jgi:hypothetical protein
VHFGPLLFLLLLPPPHFCSRSCRTAGSNNNMRTGLLSTVCGFRNKNEAVDQALMVGSRRQKGSEGEGGSGRLFLHW